MGGSAGLQNVARASFKLDSTEETPSLTRELQRSRCVFPRGEDGQPAGLTFRYITKAAGGLFRPLRSEVTIRRRIRAYQSKNSPRGRNLLRGIGRAALGKWFSVPHWAALMSIWPVTAAATSKKRRSCRHPCQPLVQPPHGNLAVGHKLTVTTDELVPLPGQLLARHGTGNASFPALPPLEDGIKHVLTIFLHYRKIEIQDVDELAIEILFVRADRSIRFVPDAGVDMMRSGRLGST